jgi:cytosine deaminase
VEERGAALVRQVAALGTGRLRTHVDIDPQIGLDHLHAVLALKERFAHLVDMQVVAFPQSGIVRCPGVAELLDRALEEGATHIGGLDPAGIDGDVAGHLDVVFSLAREHDAGIDIHLHDGGETGLMELRDIAERTGAAGLSGRVVVSHAFALGGPEEIGPTVEALAAAGVAILTHGPGPVPMPPVTRLWREGVAILAGSDNIRDAWSPYGDGDMLRRAMMIGYRQGMNEDAELALLFSIVSERTSATMGFPPHALEPGGAADLVLLDATGPVEAVATVPQRRLVMKAGDVVAENGALT